MGGVRSPLTKRALPRETANLILLCKCIFFLIAAPSSHWADQNTNITDCLHRFWPFMNFRVNLVKLQRWKSNYENSVNTLASNTFPMGCSERTRLTFNSYNGQCTDTTFDRFLKTLSFTPRTFKNRNVVSFFRVGRFAYDGCDICMVESDTAESFSAVHDKLHLLIQPDSSSTS